MFDVFLFAVLHNIFSLYVIQDLKLKKQSQEHKEKTTFTKINEFYSENRLVHLFI
jgi:hypothetical protein